MLDGTGQSDEGKSTLCKLICKILEPTKGKVLVDGIELSEISLENFLEIEIKDSKIAKKEKISSWFPMKNELKKLSEGFNFVGALGVVLIVLAEITEMKQGKITLDQLTLFINLSSYINQYNGLFAEAFCQLKYSENAIMRFNKIKVTWIRPLKIY